MKRIEQADTLRGIAILMVFLYHSIIVHPVNLHEISWCARMHDFLWVAQMPLFFLVSGLCFTYDGDYVKYFAKKSKRLLIPHVFFGLIDILPRLIPNELVNEQMDLKDALIDFFIYGGSDWFLWTLWIIVILFPFFDYIYSKGMWGKTAFILVSLGSYLLCSHSPDELLINMAARYLFYFSLGYVIKKECPLFFVRMGSVAAIASGMGMTIIGFILYIQYDRNILAELICSLGVIAVCSYMCGKINGKRLLAECSRWSLPMYLLNGYALVFIRTVVVRIAGIRSPLPVIGINFFFCLMACLIASKYIVSKSRLLSILCGIKTAPKEA